MSLENRFAIRACLLLGALAIPMPVRGEGPPQVAAEFKIDSPTFRARPALNSAAVQQDVAARLARAVGDQFDYLRWKPAHLAAAGGPRVVLTLADDRVGLCDPPNIWLRLSAARDGTVLPLDQVPFLEACDPSSIDWTAEDFLTEVQRGIDGLFAKPELLNVIERELLANILLTKSFEPDTAQQKVFLPLDPRDLKADPESEIVVRFGADQSAGQLYLRPQNVLGKRTLVFLKEFACGAEITSGGPLPETGGRQWHPGFEQFLQHCHDPSVYMKKYVRARLGITSGVVLSLDGDQP